ncbi:MAG: NHL domain-containing protein [Limisphaerales bacterium]
MKNILHATFALILSVGAFAQNAPTITEQPASQTILQGANATLSVAVSGAGPFTYQWRFNGTNLPNVITTVAGGGSGSDGGAATNASLNQPTGVAVDASDNVFIAEKANNRVRKVGANGIITTVAGNGTWGYSGDGGAAVSAELAGPFGVAVDSFGNLYIGDTGNNRIRKVGTNGLITTVPGAFSGDGGSGTNANFYYPLGVAVDGFGNVFLADGSEERIRKLGTNGIITTVAGNGARGYSGDGGAAINTALNSPFGVAVDALGNLFVADTQNNRVRKVGTNGIITTVAGGGSGGDGGAAANASLYETFGVAVDGSGNLFIATAYSIRKVGTDGIITTVTADVGIPYGVAVDGGGNVFIADYANNNIRKVTAQGPMLALNSVGAGTAGNYDLVVTSPFGSITSSVASLTVLFPPAITQQSQSQSVPVGATAAFNVTATGTPPLSYAWYFNGTNLLQAGTNSTLYLAKVSLAAGGNYTVVITNLYGSMTSSVATLSVGYPPTIASEPTNQTTWFGSNVTLNVAAAGAGRFSYQWQLNGADLPSIISTVAGGGVGDGGAATNASLVNASGEAVDRFGNLFIADQVNNRIRKVDTNGIITTVAGNGAPGFSGDGGPAASASLSSLGGVALDTSGNLFIAANYRIRKVDLNGTITTVVGNGSQGYSGDGGAATNASLNNPLAVAVDALGNIFIADSANNRIRKVDVNGIITTVAGLSASDIAVDGSGNLFVAANYRILKVDVNGIITTVAGNENSGDYWGNDPSDGGAATNQLLAATGVAVDGSGNLFIADRDHLRIRKVDVKGIITTVAGGGINDPGDGRAATNARLSSPSGVRVDVLGNLFIVDGGMDGGNGRIRKVDVNGIITTVAGNGLPGYSGDGGPAIHASLSSLDGVAVDASGNLFIADTANNRIRKVGTNGIITTVAGGGTHVPLGTAATNATLSHPAGVAVDAWGNLFIADAGSGDVYKVDTNGIINSVNAGTFGEFLNAPSGVAVDARGNVFIADTGNRSVLHVDTNGIITTVAGNGSSGFSGDGGAATNASLGPYGVAVDASGNLFMADRNNHRIRKVDTNGIITTVAGNGATYDNWESEGYFSGDGGAATNASLDYPSGVAVDAWGNLFIADSGNNRIRRVDVNGVITTVAGNGPNGNGPAHDGTGGPKGFFSGDDGAATNASLDYPSGVAVDASGNLFIADYYNNRVREVALGGSPDLTLDNVSAGNAGDYQVITTSPYGSVTSAVASVTVLLPPSSQIPGKVMSVPLIAGNNLVLGFSLSQTTSASLLSLLQAPAVNGPWTTNTTAVLTRNAQTGGYQFSVPVPGSVEFYQLRSP